MAGRVRAEFQSRVDLNLEEPSSSWVLGDDAFDLEACRFIYFALFADWPILGRDMVTVWNQNGHLWSERICAGVIYVKQWLDHS